MPLTNNKIFMIACPSSSPNECSYECDGTSTATDAAFELEFDFRSEYSSSESESESESESDSTPTPTSRSESPGTLHDELADDSISDLHLHSDRTHELALHAPSQPPSSARTHPFIRTRSLTLPATTTVTANRPALQPAPASAAGAPPRRPTLGAARTTDALAPTRSLYKKPHSYDLHDDFLHAAPAARAALAARFHRRIFYAPPPPPSQPSAQAFTSTSAPHLAGMDAAVQRRSQGG